MSHISHHMYFPTPVGGSVVSVVQWSPCFGALWQCHDEFLTNAFEVSSSLARTGFLLGCNVRATYG